MIKNNLYNRVFKFKEFMHEYKNQENIIKLADKYINKIEKCSHLMEVFELHKDMWNKGFQHPYLGPCQYGMFRTQSIERMRPSQVYLGGVYGLLTKPLSEWERYKDTRYGGNGFGIDPETKMYDLILNQYKQHLISNIKMLEKQATMWLKR